MICSAPGCSRPRHALTLCDRHYARVRRTGNIEDPHPATVEERFWAKVNMAGECWLWTGSRTGFGHGKLLVNGRLIGAHVVSYEIHVGSVPPGMFVCHHCDNPPCVSPSHLFLGTHADNMRDMAEKGRGAKEQPSLRGSLNHRSRLTEDDVREIRRRIDAGETRRGLAREYQVSKTTIQHAYNGKTWSHVTEESA